MNATRLLPHLLAPGRATAIRGTRTSLSRNCSRSAKGANKVSSIDSSSTDRFIAALGLNKEWASKIAKEQPELFPTLAAGQNPEILWIGCSDSRCPETTLLGLKPGDVFVHRNIANVLHPSDLSSSPSSNMPGHTCCGGVAAALGNKQLGILDPWLLPLRQLREENLELLQSLSADEAAVKLVEFNVLAGVKVLKQKNVVLEAMQQGLKVHGVVYDVSSGVIRQLDTSEPADVVKARLTSFKTDV
ncbi:carbonic anhydrase [Aspergillus rambellii]|uniref:Carbonic anhydrase n=1 Tax=Aspergillus rambellii TaxID=308745 RepID=A0A0F8UE12_9EURO|nr:carbonic anhydrase [Aspergillus rambellii]